jgi:hypothetical protein
MKSMLVVAAITVALLVGCVFAEGACTSWHFRGCEVLDCWVSIECPLQGFRQSWVRCWYSRLCDLPGGGQEEEWDFWDSFECGC